MSDHYCTYFDHRYAAQGLAMLRSLRAHGGSGTAWVLCLSEQAERVIQALAPEGTRIVRLTELEQHFDDLPPCKIDRSLIEYYFTLTPHIIRYVFDMATDAQRVAYLDGDLFFFNSSSRVWGEINRAPAAIFPHNFQSRADHLRKYGTYNVGWVSFSRSEQGFACLDFWRTSCRNWCRDVPEDGRFADQGYLDRFVEFAPQLTVVRHKGCNVGPWNIGRYRVHLTLSGDVMVDDDPLIFFHFTGFKKGPLGRWYNSHRIYRSTTTTVVRDHIYRPYLNALSAVRSEVEDVLSKLPQGPERSAPASVLKRNRGGGERLKAAIFSWIVHIHRIMDLVGGWTLKEPGERR